MQGETEFMFFILRVTKISITIMFASKGIKNRMLSIENASISQRGSVESIKSSASSSSSSKEPTPAIPSNKTSIRQNSSGR
jgi:hypothetical protein